MAIGKTLRFEVFARDQFTCQYCGQRPPDVVLECDHIQPVSKGGTDESLNLITACFACNRGKRDKIIDSVGPRPDADLAMLRLEQERLEIERFLRIRSALAEQRALAVEALQDDWLKYLTPDTAPSARVLEPWIERYGVEEVHKSILAAAPAYNRNRFGIDEDRAFDKLVPYIGAILRNRSEDKDSGAVQ